jgi:hypothetical protein
MNFEYDYRKARAAADRQVREAGRAAQEQVRKDRAEIAAVLAKHNQAIEIRRAASGLGVALPPQAGELSADDLVLLLAAAANTDEDPLNQNAGAGFRPLDTASLGNPFDTGGRVNVAAFEDWRPPNVNDDFKLDTYQEQEARGER